MSAIGPDAVLQTFLLFCRIGACLMLMPGYASPRVPAQVRLLICAAATLALAPLLLPAVQDVLSRPEPPEMIALVASETLTGALLGLVARVFFLALQFMAVAAASFAGYGGAPGLPIEEAEPAPAFATLITVTATVLFFNSDLHWQVLRALAGSYALLPVAAPLLLDASLARLADATSYAFILALQISSPFVAYALVVNLMFGIANKLVPQIPVYFISVPFVIAGGLFLLYIAAGELLRLFLDGFASFMVRA